VAGKVDPISDIEVIQTELCLADLILRPWWRSTVVHLPYPLPWRLVCTA
jgi:hypothetical protein